MARANPSRKTVYGKGKPRRAKRPTKALGKSKSPSLRGWLGRGALAALVVFVGYAVWLDITVRARFEGATWALPARIYARPLELYLGRQLDPADLATELKAAGYHQVRRIARAGSFARAGAKFEIATRGFAFWDGAEPPRRLRVRLANGQVSGLTEGGQATALARIDPALIGRIYPGHREDRILVKTEEMPALLLQGLLAVEDRSFYQHHGISGRGIARAMWANIRAGGTVQGGSTLTQQLAKNLFLSADRRLWRKVNEAFMALVLELRYSKAAILEAYLNDVYLGQEGSRSIHGFGLAAWFYFGRRIDELDAPESALLIGMVKGASLYNPRRKPARARARRNLVLDVMASQNVITDRAAKAAKATPLGVSRGVPKGRSPHPAFLDLVRAQLARDYRESDLRTEGLRIFTSLEPIAQRRAESVLAEQLEVFERKPAVRKGTLQGAVALVRPASGEVAGLVGDRVPRAAGFNRALKALRPIGSLVKPAVYLAALDGDLDFHLMSPLLDAPLTVQTPGQAAWSPQNYNQKFAGELPLVAALAQSNNVASVRLGLAVGLPSVSLTLRQLGVERRVVEVPAMLLGSVALTPLEVAQAYQPLGNQGFLAPLRAIREVTDANGKALSRYGLRLRRAASVQSVYLLRHGLERVMIEGTGRSAGRYIGPEQRFAGKTGSTDGLRDSWFAGFNDELLGVVWVGRDDNKPAGLTGASGALQIWARIVPHLVAPITAAASPPEGIEWHWVNVDGRSVTAPECPGAVPMPFDLASMPGFEPCGSVTGNDDGAGGLGRAVPPGMPSFDEGAG